MGFLVEEGIKAVCFDIDGTFYPLWKTQLRVALASLRSIFFALRYNKARQRVRTEDSFLSLPPMDERERAARMCSYMWDRDGDDDISYFLEKEEKVFLSFYRRSFSSISPYPGVRRTLEKIEAEGYRMGVLSDFPVGTKIKAMDFDRFFPIQLSSESWGRYKPCLTPFQLLSSAIGVEPHAILYVGDSLSKDIRGASRAGFRTALLDRKNKGSGEADIVFSTWDELYGKLF